MNRTEQIPYYRAIEKLSHEPQRIFLKRIHKFSEIISNEAVYTLKFTLLAELSYIMSRAIHVHYILYRNKRLSKLDLLKRKSENLNDSIIYDSFCDQISEENYASLYAAYPLLKKYVSNTIQQWIDYSVEMIERFVKDKKLIVSKLEGNFNYITDISHSIADKHSNGRSVAILSFEGGSKIVYKPKSIKLDYIFQKLLEELIKNKVCDLKYAQTIPMNNYGWVEFIEYKVCPSESISKFYYRAGQLIYIIHMLNGTDCHYENIIAHDGYPILIDAETLFHPYKESTEYNKKYSNILYRNKIIENSVLRTGLITNLESINGQIIDISALGAIQKKYIVSKRPVWVNVNTDYISIQEEERKDLVIANTQNLPFIEINSEVLDINSMYIIKGFEDIRKVVSDKALKIFHKYLVSFKNKNARYVFRPTQFYYNILYNLYHPNALVNIDNREKIINLLYEPYKNLPNRNQFDNIIKAEEKALVRGDIPVFYHKIGHQELLEDNNISILPFIWKDNKSKLLNIISKKQSDLQKDIINNSICSRVLFDNTNLKKYKSTLLDSIKSKISLDDIHTHIKDIYKIIVSRSIINSNRTVSWISLTRSKNLLHYNTSTLDTSLYDGLSGIWISLASYMYLTNTEKSLNLIKYIKNTIKIHLLNTSIDIGGLGDGLCSIIYASSIVDEILESDHNIEIVNIAFNQLKIKLKDNNFSLDLLGGTPGQIISLIKLNKIYKVHEAINIAEELGKSIIDFLIKRNDLLNNHSNYITGIAHGLSGVALSLIYLYKATNNKVFIEYAKIIINTEDRLIDYRLKNFESIEYLMKYTWCNGYIGTSLVRILYKTYDKDYNFNQIALLNKLNSDVLPYVDHICCGKFGLVELYNKLNGNYSINDNLDILKKIIKLDFSYKFLPTNTNVISPSFFQGYSGILYVLLKSTELKQLPSLLLFE